MFIHRYTFAYMTTPDNNKPFPIRLGDELKPFLQGEASTNKRSLHYWIKEILLDYKKKKETKNEAKHNPSAKS